MLVITKISDLTYITISHNYSTELLKLPWSFPTGCFSISLQKCEFKSIGNRKWAWVVYLVSLASPNDPDLEWKPRPQLVGSAEPFARPEAVPSDFWSISSRDSFQVLLLLMFLETQISCFNMTKRWMYSKHICQQTIRHLGISTFLFSHHQIVLVKVDHISTLYRSFW